MVGLMYLLLIVLVNLVKIESYGLRKSPTSVFYAESPSSTTTALEILQKRVPPYQSDEYFEFIRPNNPAFSEDYVNGVLHALVGVQDFASTALRILGVYSERPATDNPSFLRYFRSDNFQHVGNILQTLLIVLGAPGTEDLKACVSVPKLLVYFGAHPQEPEYCLENGLLAYLGKLPDENGSDRSFMVVCYDFYAKYKYYHQIQCSTLGPSSDLGQKSTADMPIDSASATLLHELLHWREMTGAAGKNRIVDALVTHPDLRWKTIAYRAYYSMMMKHPEWEPTVPQTENVDNYVFMVLELYYGSKCPALLPWQDPLFPRIAWLPNENEIAAAQGGPSVLN